MGLLVASLSALVGTTVGFGAPVFRFPADSGNTAPYVLAWRVLGPFEWTEPFVPSTRSDDSPVVGRQLDHPFGLNLKVEGGTSDSLPIAAQGRLGHLYRSRNGLVRMHEIVEKTDFRVAYATAAVLSDTNRDVALLAESDDGIKIWLNGEMVVRRPLIRRIAQFSDYTPVRLRAGENRLIVKLAHTKQNDVWDPWDFAIGIRTLEAARFEVVNRSVPPFFPTVILAPGRPLPVDLRLFAEAGAARLRVKDRFGADLSDTRLSSGRIQSVPLPDSALGPLTAELQVGSRSYRETLFRGSVDETVTQYDRLLPAYFGELRHRINLGALLTRLHHLLSPEHRENDNQLWQKKIADAVWSVESILGDIRARRDPYRAAPGTHLRGFVSKIDGSVQHYLVHAPPEAAAGPVPLVVIVPFVEYPLRPFLESIAVAEYSTLRILDRAADRNHMAYLWFNNRGNTGGQPIGISDLFQAVESVKEDYPIDADRVYLFGACSGGRDALAIAAAYPHLFAAVGLLSTGVQYGNTTDSDPATDSDRFACAALERRGPLTMLRNLAHVPVYAIHGDEDWHNPLAASLALRDAAQAAGLQFRLDIVEGATHLRFPVEPRDRIFDFFNGRTRLRAPQSVSYTTPSLLYRQAYWVRIDQASQSSQSAAIKAAIDTGSRRIDVQTSNIARFAILPELIPAVSESYAVSLNGRPAVPRLDAGEMAFEVTPGTGALANAAKSAATPGPVSDAFAGPFLVVVGSRGAGGERSAAQGRRFVQTWSDRFFTKCRLKRDVDVTPEDVAAGNLVLFGSPESNLVLGSIAADLPIRQLNDSVEVGGMRVAGSALAVQAVFPNPRNPERYIVLPGDCEGLKCPANAVQLALKGWYDAAVWTKLPGGDYKVLAAGYFGPDWKTFQPAAPCR